MPKLIENFSDEQLSLIVDSTQSDISFNLALGDYVRVTVIGDTGIEYTGPATNVFQFYSNKNINSANMGMVEGENNLGLSDPQIEIYSSPAGDIFVKPNEILNLNNVPRGNYLLKLDFLRNVFRSIPGGGNTGLPTFSQDYQS